jgi:hypothetical protein
MQSRELAKKPFYSSLHRSQKLEPGPLTVCTCVLVTACDVLSFRSRKYRVFRGGIRVLEITLFFLSLDSLRSTFYALGFTFTT